MSIKNEMEISSITEGLECLLADAVRTYPILYDKSHKFHLQSAFPERHLEVWNRISDDLNLEVDSCRTLWSCIKQKFIKYRKRLDNNVSHPKEWKFYDTLRMWLDSHIKKRK